MIEKIQAPDIEIQKKVDSTKDVLINLILFQTWTLKCISQIGGKLNEVIDVLNDWERPNKN